jgi:biopolymer transport protein ExbB/TolQ
MKIICSMIGIALLILGILTSKILVLNRALRKPGDEFKSALLGQIAKQEPVEVLAWLSKQKTFLSRVLEALLPLRWTNPQVMQRAAEQMTQREIHRAERGLRHLPVLGFLVLFLGVLGTIDNFANGARRCSCSFLDAGEKAPLMARGIEEALSFTWIGLVAAISTFLLHSFLQEKIQQRLNVLSLYRNHLMRAILQCQEGKNHEDSPYSTRTTKNHLYEATLGPAALFLAPLSCLMAPIICFLLMGITIEPQVRMVPVRYAYDYRPDPDPMFRPIVPLYQGPDIRLQVSEVEYELCAAGKVLMKEEWDQPIRAIEKLDEALAQVRADYPDLVEMSLRCHDRLNLQEVVTLIDVCRSRGFVTLTLMDR